MRLLNTERLELEEFLHPNVPSYIILSHTWGDGEPTFQNFSSAVQGAEPGAGTSKIMELARRARAVGAEYVWVDTICIDKTSSAELSEAINLMYKWYEKAKQCWVYLSDLDSPKSTEAEGLSAPLTDLLETDLVESDLDMYAGLDQCRYWTRGWTLQELLAPRVLLFFNAKWQFVGKIDSAKQVPTVLPFERMVSNITRIPTTYLKTEYSVGRMPRTLKAGRWPVKVFAPAVAMIMSWAADRYTTRAEDRAYSLMGLFNISMPLLYGEGGTTAFKRLQKEIINNMEDESIFAWNYFSWDSAASGKAPGLLAQSPDDFSSAAGIVPYNFVSRPPAFITSRGLQIVTANHKRWTVSKKWFRRQEPEDKESFLLTLNCAKLQAGHYSPVLIKIERGSTRPGDHANTFYREGTGIEVEDLDSRKRARVRSIAELAVPIYIAL